MRLLVIASDRNIGLERAMPPDRNKGEERHQQRDNPMNTQHRDILTTIERYGPITSAGIAEILAKPLYGYGGTMSGEELRDHVSKINGYLKKKGLLISEERPQAKGKPLMFWSLANPQSDCQPAEMASDVAEVEAVTEECSATDKESLTVEPTTPEPVSVEIKTAVWLTPISVQDALAGKPQWMGGNEFSNFLLGIEFAEKHHGISQ